MFTVKITDKDGHTVKECASYRYRKDSHGQGDAPDTDSLDLYSATGEREWVRITGTTYVMNSAGKTIDTFYATRAKAEESLRAQKASEAYRSRQTVLPTQDP